MSSHTLLTIAPYLGAVLTFKPDIALAPIAFEPGMHAFVPHIEYDADWNLFHFTLDGRMFHEENKALMTPNYYDTDRVPRLTAFEAGQWKDVTHYYSEIDRLTDRLEILGRIDQAPHIWESPARRTVCYSLFPNDEALHYATTRDTPFHASARAFLPLPAA